MKIVGKISKIDHENGYGFVQGAGTGSVFFTRSTNMGSLSFEQLSVGMAVKLIFCDSVRGKFATELELCKLRSETLPSANATRGRDLDSV